MTSPEKAMTPTEALEKIRGDAAYWEAAAPLSNACKYAKSRLVLAEALARALEWNDGHYPESGWKRGLRKALIEAAGGGE